MLLFLVQFVLPTVGRGNKSNGSLKVSSLPAFQARQSSQESLQPGFKTKSFLMILSCLGHVMRPRALRLAFWLARSLWAIALLGEMLKPQPKSVLERQYEHISAF